MRFSQRALVPDDRLQSLDVFRGLIVAAMILVTDPGTYNAVYWPLLHAQWTGVTPTDLIFPSFLVISGIAITLSFAARLRRGATPGHLLLHTLRRGGIIFLLGLAVNGFPDYHLQTIRIPGILQRIALCYIAGALLYLAAQKWDRKQLPWFRSGVIGGTAAALLGVYWALLKLVPVPGFGAGHLDSRGNVAAYVDRALIGIPHMWPWGLTPGYGVTFDPEGLLSTIPALATLLIGLLAGEWIRTSAAARRTSLLAAAGAVLVLISLALTPLLPLNKKIWTSTFALFSGGVALALFSIFYWVVDVKRWRAWTAPLLVFGANAITAFVLSSVITVVLDRIHVPAPGGLSIPLHQWAYQSLFAAWLVPVHASLAYAILIVVLNLALMYFLYRKHVFLRV